MMMNESWCNNCAKQGHSFNQCKIPITSFGCIVFRINKHSNKIEYLMICRRYSIAFLEFIRGKYNLNDIDNIRYLLQQMTNKERDLINTGDFNKIWNTTWGHSILKFNGEEYQSNEKYNLLCKQGLNTIIAECLNETETIETINTINTYISETQNEQLELFPKSGWITPEWGFPKGRREYKESDYNCAIREFNEETGINIHQLHQIENVLPIEENFMGSNYKTYKHKYYLMYMNYEDTLIETKYQKSEVSEMAWKTVDECIQCIRPYNVEKKCLIKNIDDILHCFVILETPTF